MRRPRRRHPCHVLHTCHIGKNSPGRILKYVLNLMEIIRKNLIWNFWMFGAGPVKMEMLCRCFSSCRLFSPPWLIIIASRDALADDRFLLPLSHFVVACFASQRLTIVQALLSMFFPMRRRRHDEFSLRLAALLHRLCSFYHDPDSSSDIYFLWHSPPSSLYNRIFQTQEFPRS